MGDLDFDMEDTLPGIGTPVERIARIEERLVRFSYRQREIVKEMESLKSVVSGQEGILTSMARVEATTSAQDSVLKEIKEAVADMVVTLRGAAGREGLITTNAVADAVSRDRKTNAKILFGVISGAAVTAGAALADWQKVVDGVAALARALGR